MASTDPFIFVNEINSTKKTNLIDEDPSLEKKYLPFLINRALSYFSDTIMIANSMNLNSHLDNKLQNDFFINMVRPRRRFSKWAKPIKNEDVEAICEYYNCNMARAFEIESILTIEQLGEIKNRVFKGGVEK